MADLTIDSALDDDSVDSEVALGLQKKSRVGESIIKGFLFACGVLSIFTTIGIVVILLNESVRLFANTTYEETRKELAVAMDATQTTIEGNESGKEMEAGMKIRVNEEIMQVISVEEGGSIAIVERGIDGTVAVMHDADARIDEAIVVTLREVFSGTVWQPQIASFGMWPLILSTLMISFIAMLVSLPLGLASAIFLSEYASDRVRSTLKPILEILAGIPTVVYGFFALTFMTPILRFIFGADSVQIFNMLSAGIVVGILIIPLVSSMSEDALHAVPDSLRQAAYGLGATKFETALRVVLPAALSGVTAAFVVAISRAVGETMIVAVAAGSAPRNFPGWSSIFTEFGVTPFNVFQSGEAMTGHMVRISSGDLSYDSIDYNSIFSIGLVLFVITLLLNIVSRRIVERFREEYD